MKITIVNRSPQRGHGQLPVTRSFEADDLLNENIPTHNPELRTAPLFVEIRKLLLYCKYDVHYAPWDETRLDKLELQLGTIGIEASFPQRFSAPRVLSAELAVKAIDNAMELGWPELKFFVTWEPFCPGVWKVAQHRLGRRIGTAPIKEAICLQAQKTYTSLKEINQRFQIERKSLAESARRARDRGKWESLDDNWYGM